MGKILLYFSLLLTAIFTPNLMFGKSITAIEQEISGRIGVAVLDTQNGEFWSYRGDEHFPLLSTFKTLACAAILHSEGDSESYNNITITIEEANLITWSPVMEKLVGKDVTVEQACEATMLTSDNTAVNIVLEHVGGPQGLTRFLRGIGDNVTRLDRIEPELNEAMEGDFRDTTTPNAMLQTLDKLLLGEIMSKASKKQLRTWMKDNEVSTPLLRTILPAGWSIADRSGAGGNGSRAITAIIWAKSREAIIICIYLTQTNLSMEERNGVIRQIGEILFEKYAIK